MTFPPLSSISLDIARGGYEAARKLDIMMRDGTKNIGNIIIKPKEVVTRASTDILTIDDPEVVRALYFISENSRQNIQVTDVADNIGINRRSLERRFRKALNKSIYDKIKQARIEAMIKMLTETDIPVSEIAYKMGFNDANHISRYFKLEKGVSPLNFRRNHKSL
jgi:LacI family transcriptional regulator